MTLYQINIWLGILSNKNRNHISETINKGVLKMKLTLIESKRSELGITKRGLARRIGFSADMIYRVETRRFKASWKFLFAVCESLNLSPLEVAKDLGMDTKYLGGSK